MKNIVKTILSIAAFLVPVTGLFAQQQQVIPDSYHDMNGLVYSKIVQGPNDKGEYTIYLKSFVTGTVTEEVKAIPSDIILVLDVSGSMDYAMSGYGYDYWTAFVPSISAGSGGWNNNNSKETDYYYKVGDTYYRVNIGRTSRQGGNRYYYLYYNIGNTRYYIHTDGTISTTQPTNITNSDDNLLAEYVPLYEYRQGSRMDALKEAVGTFVGLVKENAEENNVDNQIAVVKFAMNSYYNGVDNITPGDHDYTYTASGYQTVYNANYTEVVAGFTAVTGGGDETLKTAVNKLHAAGATAADYGMTKAQKLLNTLYDSNGNPTRTSNKIVVLFTDGDPTYASSFDNTVANNAISTSKEIKKLLAYNDAESGKSANVKVYTIGTFGTDGPTGNTVTYMNYVSSNYPEAENMTTGGTGSDQGYYILADSADKLKDAFATISSDAASSSIDLGSSTTVVDVVSKSFILPTGTDHSTVQIYTTPYLGKTGDTYNFSIDKDDWTNITNKEGISLVPNPEDGSVRVSGFDFTENMCAQNTDGTTYRGNQLILEIPIMMDENAVGGHGVQTNGPGSGISYKDKDGNDQLIEFVSPDINLPINLHIQKRGLNKGESAKFTIQRKWNGSESDKPADIDADTWYDYTSVFVTRRNETETGDDYPIVEIVGLHPDYLYKIKEEDWSWSYAITSIYGSKYDPATAKTTTVTMTADDVTSDKINLNPFIFVNSKKDQTKNPIRHAESIVRNEFKNAGTSATAGATTDSKTQPTK